MHHVTSHGAPKITMDSKERDYQERLRQAKAQGDGNPSMFGQQVPKEPEAPEAQVSSSNNSPIEDVINLSGSLNTGESMTEDASSNPEQFQTDELERRLNMYTQAASNAGYSLNDRSQTGSI